MIGRVGGTALSVVAGALDWNLAVSELRDARERGLAELIS